MAELSYIFLISFIVAFLLKNFVGLLVSFIVFLILGLVISKVIYTKLNFHNESKKLNTMLYLKKKCLSKLLQ